VTDDSPADRERVYDRIAPLILEFQRCCGERLFHAEELRTFVRDRVPEIAPASPDRILRQLRLEKRLGYEVVNRSASLYRFSPRKRVIPRQ
jgi:hypothetical protein